MHEVFNRNAFLVKEHIGVFKTGKEFDIHDPETGEVIIQCREKPHGTFTKLLRLMGYWRYTPFDIELTTPDGAPLLRVARGVAFLRSVVRVHDAQDQLVGSFKQQLFTLLGGYFWVLDAEGQPVFGLKGKWTNRNFRFLAGGLELARVAQKWTGISREALLSAESYLIEITENVPSGSPARQLIVAAALCVDMVLKQ